MVLTPMPPNTDAPRLPGAGKHYRIRLRGLAGSLIGVAAGGVALILAIVFSLFLFAALLAAGVTIGGYFWWKTRKARQLLREHPLHTRAPRERVVEGEVLHVEANDARAQVPENKG